MTNKFSLPKLSLIVNNPYPHNKRISIRTNTDAVEIFKEIWEPGTIELYESVYVLFLNKSMRVLGYIRQSYGSIDGCVFDPRLILATALLSASTGIIVAHNHPSGNTQPSMSDETITRKLKDACAVMSINFLDHIIITADSYFSFKDEGLT